MLLQDTREDEIDAIWKMEQGEVQDFIIPYSLEKHTEEMKKPDVIYKSIYVDKKLVGFIILALDADGESVEFRRIVVSDRGQGIGRKAVEMVYKVCNRELKRDRVWLDVFESNERARHVYEKAGYRSFGKSDHDGRALVLYERHST